MERSLYFYAIVPGNSCFSFGRGKYFICYHTANCRTHENPFQVCSDGIDKCYQPICFTTGFILLITSAYLIRGQSNRRSAAMILSVISLFGHLFKALDYEEAIVAASVLLIFSLSAKQYRLKSNPKLVQLGLVSVVLVFAAIGFLVSLVFISLKKDILVFHSLPGNL